MARLRLLDGGLATEQMKLGFEEIDSDPLWNARLLHTNQNAVKNAHKAFIKAGADIIETNTYQVSIDGFKKYLSLDPDVTLSLISQSVRIVREAAQECNLGEREILIAGSVGPYGACQHDASEYHGRYIEHMSVTALKDWHRPRIKALLDAGVDYLAVESLPAVKEAVAVKELIADEFPDAKAWISFSCKDGIYTNHGETLRDAVSQVVDCYQLTHVGVNCTSPEHISSLLDSVQEFRNQKSFIVYPNSGEIWSPERVWSGKNELVSTNLDEFVSMCAQKGVTILGGCCRIDSTHLAMLKLCIDKLQKSNA